MKSIVVYEETSGKILMSGFMDEATMAVQSNPVLETEKFSATYDATHYVKDKTLVERLANPVVVTGTKLSNVPVPSIVRVNGKPYETNDSTVDLDFSYPGTYHIQVESFPFLDVSFEMTV